MGIRGRAPSASLSVVPTVVEVVPRAKPPSELSDEQAEVWRAIVNRMPADWFPRETHEMLAQYSRHAVNARRVAQLIAAAEASDPLDIEEYDRLLKMQEREGRALSSLATRMRLTQQTTYDPKKKKGSTTKRPWEADA